MVEEGAQPQAIQPDACRKPSHEAHEGESSCEQTGALASRGLLEGGGVAGPASRIGYRTDTEDWVRRPLVPVPRPR